MKTQLKNVSNIPFFAFFLFFLVPIITNAQVGIGTTDPKSSFEVNGTFGQKVSTITGTTALDDTYGSVIICNNGSSAITVTLPTVSNCTGRVYTIKRNATSTAIVTINGTIDGVTNLILKDASDATTLFSNGTEWKVASNSNSSWNVKGNTCTSSTTNYLGTTDATDLVLKTNATSRVNITSTGITTIGGATDHTKFEADGTILLEGAATVWDDYVVTPDATSKGNSNPPVWGGVTGAFKKNAGNTSQGVFLWMFSAGTEQELYFTVQLPHKYKLGTALYPHVHWTTPSTSPTPSGTNVVWGLEYSVVAIGGAYPTTSTLTANSVLGAIGTPTGTGQHLITSLGAISGTGVGISTIFICRLYRIAADSNDTYPNEVGLLSMDFHYEIDTEGSRSEFTK